MFEGSSGPCRGGINKHTLLGIVSEHHLLAAVDGRHKLSALVARDIMTCNPYSIHREALLPTLVHVLRASDLIRVPGGGCQRQTRWASLPSGMLYVQIPPVVQLAGR